MWPAVFSFVLTLCSDAAKVLDNLVRCPDVTNKLVDVAFVSAEICPAKGPLGIVALLTAEL